MSVQHPPSSLTTTRIWHRAASGSSTKSVRPRAPLQPSFSRISSYGSLTALCCSGGLRRMRGEFSHPLLHMRQIACREGLGLLRHQTLKVGVDRHQRIHQRREHTDLAELSFNREGKVQYGGPIFGLRVEYQHTQLYRAVVILGEVVDIRDTVHRADVGRFLLKCPSKISCSLAEEANSFIVFAEGFRDLRLGFLNIAQGHQQPGVFGVPPKATH